MNKHQALQLVSQAIQMYRGTLQEHQQLQEAIQVLSKELTPKKEENGTTKNDTK